MQRSIVRTAIVVSLLAVILAGCTANQSQGNNTPVVNNQAIESPTAMPKELTAYFNPYNYATESDGKDVFYSVLTGIYKLPNGNGRAEKIIDGQTIVSIALHNSTIYYIDNSKLCRVDKSGANQITFEVTDNALTVGCLDDTLYISTSDGYYTANIPSDPDVLTLKQSRGRPAPNGVFYSMERIPETEIGSNLFRISPDTSEATEILYDIWNQDYIITNLYIFYHDRDGIYRSDLDGGNSIKIIDGEDTDISYIHFCNYDDEWVYAGLTPGGFSRMNQETGTVEPLIFEANPGGFDIADGYLYGYDHGEKVRMKLPNGRLEFEPFE